MQENQRIRLSKKMLKDSLNQLLYKESIHKISVRDICDGAEINRTTFYKYYGSQYDLLKDLEDDVLFQIDGYLSKLDIISDDSLETLTETLTFINDNLELCRILCNNNVDPEFPKKLFNLPSIKNAVTQLMDEYNEDELDYVFGFVVNGGFSTILNWMNRENRETPKDVAAFLYKMIMKLFQKNHLT